ncbi:MAG: CoA transferase [Deltaproteobacteria bacterium]|nr:CoA transferase [Deltaproteobacteria bacterium]
MSLPLSNVRILDLTLIMAGPYCTLILGDLGAEVIKIEKPGIGESSREMPPHFFEEQSAYFIAMNRNKKSMTLDLKSEAGKKIFCDLAKVSDVVIDNFRPGVVKKLGLDFDTLKKINPRIICCSISGYGQTGPFKDRPAFDLVIQARGGIMSYTGEPGQIPVRMGAPMGDLSGGVFASQGILAALYQREKTGRGQLVDISLVDCQTSLLTYRAQFYLVGKEIAQPVGSGHVSAHPIRAFQTKTSAIVIDANTESIFAELCEAIGKPGMSSDPKFNSRESRLKNKEELYSILEAAFLEKTGEEWLELLEKRIPIAPINTIDKALGDPQTLSRNMVVEVEYEGDKKLKIIGNPIKMSEIEQETFKRPPYLGEHTEEILTGILAYNPEQVRELRNRKVV